jgi:hypothetical protein
MEHVLEDMAYTPTVDMKEMQEGCGINPVTPEVVSKRKSESPIEESLKRMKDGVGMEVSPKHKLADTTSYEEFKKKKCESFRRGVELRKGHASLLGSDGRLMNLVAQENGTFWDDDQRGGKFNGNNSNVFGGKTDTDTFAFDIRALKGGNLSSDELGKCQSMAISDTNGRVDGQVIMMKASDILVHVNVGSDVKNGENNCPLYSCRYFNAYAEYYKKGGGIFKGDVKLKVNYDSDDNEEEKVEKRLLVLKQQKIMDNDILQKGEEWMNDDARAMAYHYYENGLKRDSKIVVRFRTLVMQAGSSVALSGKVYCEGAIKILSTSSGHFSMSHGTESSYDEQKPAVLACSGVWNKNPVTKLLEMAAIEVGASSLEFTATNVASMAVETPDIKEDEDNIEMCVKDDSVSELPPPSIALYPFASNKYLKGCFTTLLTHGYRKKVVRSTTRGGGMVISKGCNSHRRSRGGVSQGIVALPKKDAPKIKYATIGVGEKMFEMNGMPSYDSNELEILKPVFTIYNMLVTEGDEVDSTPEEEDEKAVQFVDACALSMKNFEKMVVECMQASVSGIQESVVCVEKSKMSDSDLLQIEASLKMNQSASSFFKL